MKVRIAGEAAGVCSLFCEGRPLDESGRRVAVEFVDTVEITANRHMHGSEQEFRKWLTNLRPTRFPNRP
jgi:hypothetical protein